MRVASGHRNAGAGLFDSVPSPPPIRRLVCHGGDALLESSTIQKVRAWLRSMRCC